MVPGFAPPNASPVGHRERPGAELVLELVLGGESVDLSEIVDHVCVAHAASDLELLFHHPWRDTMSHGVDERKRLGKKQALILLKPLTTNGLRCPAR